jgi:hypothetical protein
VWLVERGRANLSLKILLGSYYEARFIIFCMSCGNSRGFSKRYVRAFIKVTSFVLAFSFAVSSPLSAAVAYAQTADGSSPTADGQTQTTTDQGTRKVHRHRPS